MKTNIQNKRTFFGVALLGGVSALALAQPAIAQDEVSASQDAEVMLDVIVVEGIRESLLASSELKRNAQGVIDAISSEDMGKFPDTNLAESLQRITGVSIDRQNGEGQEVTVRGFGPAFNLVLLNGRQMPTALLDPAGASSSRSFDFGNLASEGIAGVEVFKTGRADLPTGGIGSTLNIKTARPLDNPGLKYSVGAKGVIDNSVTTLGSETITPEISGIFSNTFHDDKFGVALAGSFQERQSGFAQFGTTSGWRGAYFGSENNWGTLPQPPNDVNVTNRPGPDDIYSVPQNGNYALVDIERERINGQLALQYEPTDTFTATLDYFYSQQKVDERRSDMSVWFNHGGTTSAWGDGPIADPLFYNEDFGNTDLSMGASIRGSESENNSVGLNLEWQATENLSFTFDAHNSTAESGPNSPYGTAGVLSTADFSLNFQGLDFQNELPSLSLGFQDGTDQIDASRMQGTGSVFQSSFVETEIDQYQLFAKYEFDSNVVRSVDFGVASTTNSYRATFSNNQRDSWGGVGNPEDYPDDIWTRVGLAENFDQFSGSETTYPDFFVVDFESLLAVMDTDFGGFTAVCGGDGNCVDGPVNTDRRSEEESTSAFFQVNMAFPTAWPIEMNAGLRYEQTDVSSDALVGFPTGTAWVAENELTLEGLNDPNNRNFTTLSGDYDYILPAVDFRIDPTENIIVRASYSQTLTRPSYSDIQGGQTVAQLFRVDGGDGSSGNPDLLPFVSENFDLSGEFYYNEGSYFSVGYFDKTVENFIGTSVFSDTPFDVYTPIGGARYNAAVAALGTDDANAIREWIFENADPSTFSATFDENGNRTSLSIFGVPGEDPLVSFRIARPVNEDTKNVDGWEFAWQHFLGETGLGWILNYTLVNGDVEFDNFSVPSSGDIQTPLIGLSDSYNIIGFYDKNGIQARLAYNWRSEFLDSTIGISGVPNNPLYVEDYGQLDFSGSYDVNDRLTVFVEGINITDETSRTVGRSSGYVNFATQTGSRYNIGVRYTY